MGKGITRYRDQGPASHRVGRASTQASNRLADPDPGVVGRTELCREAAVLRETLLLLLQPPGTTSSKLRFLSRLLVGTHVTPEILQLGDGLDQHLGRPSESLFLEPPYTLIHNDFYADNLFFADSDAGTSFAAVDWQFTTHGMASSTSHGSSGAVWEHGLAEGCSPSASGTFPAIATALINVRWIESCKHTLLCANSASSPHVSPALSSPFSINHRLHRYIGPQQHALRRAVQACERWYSFLGLVLVSPSAVLKSAALSRPSPPSKAS